MKILIITKAFPPQNSIASHRPYSWAKYWSRSGHDVTVLTVPKTVGPQDAPQPTNGFQVIEVPIPVWSILSSIFGKRKPSYTHSSHSKADKIPHGSTSIKDLLYKILIEFLHRYGIFSGCRMPDVLDLWGRVAYKAVRHQNWDLVVSTAWPYGVHRPGYKLKKSGRASYWITDWRDLWTDNHMYPGIPGFRSLERKMEKQWSRTADAITTVSEPLAEILREKYGNKVHVIYNGFDPEDYASLPKENIFLQDNVFRIVYTGSIYPGQRDPTPLFKAVHKLHMQKLVRPELLKIIFCGSNSDVKQLAHINQVEDFVEYAGFLPRQQALQMQRDANILLFLESESKEVKGILTGKLFEYLFAGPPIIGIGIDENSSVGVICKRTGRGKCLGSDLEKIAEELKIITSTKHNNSCLSKKIIIEDISEFSRKLQSEKLLNILK